MLNGLALRNGFEAAPQVRKNRFEYSATVIAEPSQGVRVCVRTAFSNSEGTQDRVLGNFQPSLRD
jgi:hypothetical protein